MAPSNNSVAKFLEREYKRRIGDGRLKMALFAMNVIVSVSLFLYVINAKVNRSSVIGNTKDYDTELTLLEDRAPENDIASGKPTVNRASDGENADADIGPLLRRIYGEGRILVNSKLAKFQNTLQEDGKLNPRLVERVMTEVEYATIEEAFRHLRERLLSSEADTFKVVDNNGSIGVSIPPILDLEKPEIEAFRRVLEGTLGESKGESLWMLMKLSPFFVELSGSRLITFHENDDIYWDLRVSVSDGIIESTGKRSRIPKESTFHEGAGMRYAHILDIPAMLHRNQENN